MRLCEVTLKKEKIEGAAAGSKRPGILHRRVEVPELKSSVRLKVSTEGMEAIKTAGGLVKFLEQRDEKKLSKKLRLLKQKLLAEGVIKVPESEKAAEETPPAEAAAASAEASAEAAAEEQAEAKGEEAAAEAVPSEEKSGS